MKAIRFKKILSFTLIALCLLTIVKIILFFTAIPKPTVDYIAKYNQSSKPENYDPAQNAAEDYQKAFDTFVPMPEPLIKQYRPLPKPANIWPSDLNDDELAMLQKWLNSNNKAFEYFRTAAGKPYYWIERKEENGNGMYSMVLHECGPMRDLLTALLWNAKLNALKGDLQSAFNDTLTVYKAGRHKCRKSLLVMEQFDGLRMQNDAMKNALFIMSKSSPQGNEIKYLRDTLTEILLNNDYCPCIKSGKFALKDVIQRTFINDDKSNGRMAWRVSEFEYIHFMDSLDSFTKKLFMCLFGPTQNDLIRDYDHVLDLSENLMNKTPWRLIFEEQDTLSQIDNIINSHFILHSIGYNPKWIINYNCKTKSQTNALITVLAVLLYKADTGQFPESLDTLVSNGYLIEYPNDPYNNGPLKYRRTEDNFILYSVGEDFTDNGGIIRTIEKPMPPTFPDMKNPHIVKLSQKMIPYKYYTDIIYWPVNNKH